MRRLLLALVLVSLSASAAHAMKLNILKGTTCADTTPRPCLVDVFMQDSSSTTGAGLTGLTSGSSGLVCYRARSDDGNAGGTQITLSAGTKGTWSSGGFVEKDATNLPGVYEIGLPTTAVATGSNFVLVMCKGATNLAPMVLEIALTNYDPQDSVRLGLTALPNAAAEAAGGLYTRGSGAGQINQAANGMVDTNSVRLLGTAYATPATAGVIDANVKNINNVAAATPGAAGGVFIAGTNAATTVTTALTTTFTGNLTGSVGSVTGAVGSLTTNNDKTGYSLTQSFPTNFSSLSIDANGRVKIQGPINKNVALSTPTMFLMTDSTNHNPQTGLTVACTRAIDGGAFAAGTLGAVSEIANGWYALASYGAGDLNGNEIITRCTATNADDVGWTLKTYP